MKIKHLILALVAVIFSVSVASASDRYLRDDSELPAAARTAVNKHFKAPVSFIKVDKDFGRISEYEVVLTDGTEITFDNKGNWKEIETSVKKSVPGAFIPKPMAKFVKTIHKGVRIIGIEKKSKGFEVTFSNGIEAIFDAQGNFLRYDD
ncbi:MAG: PepSY-like domain-containing protein [Muribaculaceae bacterium]|nr:PepSY-like domain-containing protein [Muribaculaceae bacterium]